MPTFTQATPTVVQDGPSAPRRARSRLNRDALAETVEYINQPSSDSLPSYRHSREFEIARAWLAKTRLHHELGTCATGAHGGPLSAVEAIDVSNLNLDLGYPSQVSVIKGGTAEDAEWPVRGRNAIPAI